VAEAHDLKSSALRERERERERELWRDTRNRWEWERAHILWFSMRANRPSSSSQTKLHWKQDTSIIPPPLSYSLSRKKGFNPGTKYCCRVSIRSDFCIDKCSPKLPRMRKKHCSKLMQRRVSSTATTTITTDG